MGIIDKISDKLHGDSHSSTKNVDNYDTSASTSSHQQANRLDERTGTSTGSTTGTASSSNQGNYGVMEPNSTSASTHHGHTGTSTTNTSTSGASSGRNTEVRQAAPVTQERVHDQHIHQDNIHRTDVHEKTHVDQTVQPVYDQETRGTTHETVQHGTEVHEHGHRGIGREAEAEMARNREQIQNQHHNTRDSETVHRQNHSHGGVQTRQHNIEEVVPVVEKDVYRPHEIEHNKRVVDVHHEPTSVSGTHVNEPISAQEFQRSGNNQGYSSTSTTTSHAGNNQHGNALERGAEKATGRDLNHDGNVGNSYTTGYNTTGTTGYNTGAHGTNTHDAHSSTSNTQTGKKHGGIGEKLEHMVEKVTHKDLDHDGDVAGKPKVGTTSHTTTGNHAHSTQSNSYGTNNVQGRNL